MVIDLPRGWLFLLSTKGVRSHGESPGLTPGPPQKGTLKSTLHPLRSPKTDATFLRTCTVWVSVLPARPACPVPGGC